MATLFKQGSALQPIIESQRETSMFIAMSIAYCIEFQNDVINNMVFGMIYRGTGVLISQEKVAFQLVKQFP